MVVPSLLVVGINQFSSTQFTESSVGTGDAEGVVLGDEGGLVLGVAGGLVMGGAVGEMELRPSSLAAYVDLR